MDEDDCGAPWPDAFDLVSVSDDTSRFDGTDSANGTNGFTA